MRTATATSLTDAVFAYIFSGPMLTYIDEDTLVDRYDAIIDGEITTLDAVHGLGLVGRI